MYSSLLSSTYKLQFYASNTHPCRSVHLLIMPCISWGKTCTGLSNRLDWTAAEGVLRYIMRAFKLKSYVYTQHTHSSNGVLLWDTIALHHCTQTICRALRCLLCCTISLDWFPVCHAELRHVSSPNTNCLAHSEQSGIKARMSSWAAQRCPCCAAQGCLTAPPRHYCRLLCNQPRHLI